MSAAPVGASVLVWRRANGGIEWLVLHRSAARGEDESEWVWTPPAGARHSGESAEDGACRELLEETGLQLELEKKDLGDRSWAVFIAEAPASAQVRLDAEHDRFEWIVVEDATIRCRPERVGETFRGATRLLKEKGPLTRP
jgi:8-oxo-dGTP pyrophosphatase MutT (NUDIX family)